MRATRQAKDDCARSNAGGKSSKASVIGQVTKFVLLVKTHNKKDLVATAMGSCDTYGPVSGHKRHHDLLVNESSCID